MDAPRNASARGWVSWERSSPPSHRVLDLDFSACSCFVLPAWRPVHSFWVCWMLWFLGQPSSRLGSGSQRAALCVTPSMLHHGTWQRAQHTVGLQHILAEIIDGCLGEQTDENKLCSCQEQITSAGGEKRCRPCPSLMGRMADSRMFVKGGRHCLLPRQPWVSPGLLSFSVEGDRTGEGFP